MEIAILVGGVLSRAAAGQDATAIAVRAEVTPGPYFVGRGFELRVDVVAGAERPTIDPPRMAGARAWVIRTEVRPITATSIGSLVAREDRLAVWFRVLPRRAGTLEIPGIRAQLKTRSGRSEPKTLSIQTVPLQGRPAAFLGGVGQFELEAQTSSKVVRIGQELDFRIKVTGPAAWGMIDRPDLGRYGRLGLGLRIQARPDETTDEPPARTFVYRLRPTQAGDAVLPPVAIAAYDPSLSHYVTHVTSGVSIRVVAVPSFDPTTIHYDPPSTARSRTVLIAWSLASLSIVLSVFYVLAKRWKNWVNRPRPFGPDLARRFAKRTARYLGSLAGIRRFESDSPDVVGNAARLIYEFLASYLLLGTGHSAGVLTPEEAHQGVARLTSSDELAVEAGKLTTRCDLILYGDSPRQPVEPGKLLDDARRLFEALGRVNHVRRRGR